MSVPGAAPHQSMQTPVETIPSLPSSGSMPGKSIPNNVTDRLGRHLAWIVLLAAAHLTFVLRSAWVCDDAYISFRTVFNFTHGYGLTWNTDERVQVFTHPLWLFMVSFFYWIIGEMYFMPIFLSAALTLATFLIFCLAIAPSMRMAVLGAAILTFSKAYIDYSTSGLENPLSHLIIATFIVFFLKSEIHWRSLMNLAFIAGLGALNRLDTLLFYLPALAWWAFQYRKPNALGALAIGFLPLILWEGFSLFYYGFPFPNPAYAKLHHGWPAMTMITQGLHYYAASFLMDPLTLVAIATGLALTLATRSARPAMLAVGVMIYLLYVIWIGGDFMNGRFFTIALLVSVALIARSKHAQDRRIWPVLFSLVMLAGIFSPFTPLTSGAGYRVLTPEEEIINDHFISDERAFYYRDTGLLRAMKGLTSPIDQRWARIGVEARRHRVSLVFIGYIGFCGYFAGPGVHITDPHALTEPLLARLGARRDGDLMIGHFRRWAPRGYLTTLKTEYIAIQDQDLATYYRKIRLITRGKLLDLTRLKEIVKLNLGLDETLHQQTEDHYQPKDYIQPALFHVKQDRIDKVRSSAIPSDDPGNLRMFAGTADLLIDLDGVSHAPRIETSLTPGKRYELVFRRGDDRIMSTVFSIPANYSGNLSIGIHDVPEAAIVRGYDNIRVLTYPPGEGDCALGHLRLLD